MKLRSSAEGLAALLLAVVVVGTAVVFGSDRSREADLRASTWNDERSGAHALFLLLAECGADVSRDATATDALAQTPVDRTLVMLAPSWPVSKAEARALLDWAARGGRLVVADASSVPPALSVDVDQILHPLGLETRSAPGKGDDVTVVAEAWKKDVEEVDWSPRLVLQERAVAPAATPSGGGANPAPAAPAGTPRDERAGVAETVVKLADSPLAVRVPFGSGEVVAIADARLFANDTLGRDDNALLAARILADPARRAIAFEEFHHGYTPTGVRDGVVARVAGLVVGTWVGRAFLLVAFAGLVFAAGAAVRLGAPLPEAVPARRALREHADALGRLLESAHASRETLEILGGGVRRVCAARAGFPAALTPAEFRRRLERSLAPGAKELADALAEAEAGSLRPSVKDVELARIAANLAAAKRRFLHGGV